MILLRGRLALAERLAWILSQGDYRLGNPEHDDRGRFGTGGGGAASPSETSGAVRKSALDGGTAAAHPTKDWYQPFTVDEAVSRLTTGQKVALERSEEVATLLDTLAARAASGTKDKINLCDVTVTGTNVFCVDNKGISRIQMPQLATPNPEPGSKAEGMPRNAAGWVDVAPQFRAHLAQTGVHIEDADMSPGHMKASQNELDGAKVAGIMKALEQGKTIPGEIVVSSDGYIIDGHHRWAAQLGMALRDGTPLNDAIKVTRVKLPVMDMLKRTADYAHEWGIPNAPVFAK